jgi:hypothetical protein
VLPKWKKAREGFFHVQLARRIRCWKRIPEAGGKTLRVILLEDGRTVHNAFFDRTFIAPDA